MRFLAVALLLFEINNLDNVFMKTLPKPFPQLVRIIKSVCCLFLAFQIWSCSKLNEVRVIGHNFEDEIQLAQNLVFTFSKDLVKDSELNVWESKEYIEFSPKIEGKFKWTATNELVFSPTAGFLPATEYRAVVSPKITEKTSDEKYKVSSQKIEFHTAYLALENTETYWTKSKENGKPLAKSKLRFNYAINTAELLPKLKITADDKAIATSLAQLPESQEVTVTLTDAPTKNDSNPLIFKISKGIKVPNTAFESTEDIKTNGVLPSPFGVEIVEVQSGFENNEGYVRVITTQELQPEDLANYYTIQPQVATKAELTENGFMIKGEFGERETYILTLTDKIKGVLGAQLKETVSKDLFFGKMPASIAFANKKAVYLSSKGSKNVGISIVNVPKVQVKIGKVYENNIIHFLKMSRYENYEYDSQGNGTPNGWAYNEDYEGQYSDLVVNKTIETENLPQVKGVLALNLALPDASRRGGRGIYVVTVTSKDEMYQNATKLISISDIGLIAKQSGDDIWVFANSIKTTDALADVEINLVSGNNQLVHSLKTNREGVAHFEKMSEKTAGFKVAMITASTDGNETDSDFNYLAFSDTRVETSRFEVEGKRDNASGFEAFIYGDRDIYRPSETVHFNTLLRTKAWQNVGEVPVVLKLLMPNGREYKVFRQKTNSQGAVSVDIPTDAAAVTGTYTFEVYNGNGLLLASKTISIEEFMPDRIKVDVKSDQDFYKNGQTISLTATAQNLFGPPASGRSYEMEMSMKRRTFKANKFENYTFDGAYDGDNGTKFENQVRQGMTNESGQAAEQFIIPTDYQDIGVLEGKIYVTVFDETGRPVNRLKRFDIYTQNVFYGVRLNDQYVGLNAPLPIALVAVDKNGALQKNSKAQVQVVRYEYQNIPEKQGDAVQYVSKRKEKIVYDNLISLSNGQAECRYVPTASGEYEVRVRRPTATGYTSAEFYAYGQGGTSASSFEVSNEGEVLMEFDKPKYNVGDKATILFKTPFAGKMLVTVERNKVLAYHYLETDKKSAEWSFEITEQHLPNVYVTATLIRANDGSDMPLMVAHGFAPVRVEREKARLGVEILAAATSRSKTKQTIKIKSARNAQLTVAVVDEGILQLKNFKTPDIFEHFYQKRALEVNSHDLYALLFPELIISSRLSVGGDGYDLEKRINPLSNGRVKLVTFWSGIISTNSSGDAEFVVNIPQFSGDLRVMAVAYKDDAFGSGNANIKVADPVVISTALPRFLSPDDELIVPVNISNTTKIPMNVTATMALNGQLVAVGGLSQKLTIAAEKESRTTFVVRANQVMGGGAVTVTVENGREKFTERTDITVRPATSLLKTAQSGTVQGGATAQINLSNDFVPSSVRTKLVVSRSPLVQFARSFGELLGYPHGCVEQTISKAFPQLYVSDLAKTLRTKTYLSKTTESDYNPTFAVQRAIEKLESMQLYSGALSYWPGSEAESWWGTAYALHFLVEAKKNGFEVSPAVQGKMMDYLSLKTNAPALENQRIDDERRGFVVRKIANREAIYSLYALATAGKANRTSMNYYKQNQALLTPDSRYLLAATYRLLGDERSYNALLPKRLETTNEPPQNDGSFASPIRNVALVLNTLIETDPDNLQIPTLARQLSQAVGSAAFMNTQESAFVLLALGKLAKKASASTATAVVLGDKNQQLSNFSGVDLVLNKGINDQNLVIKSSGKGNLYWFAEREGLSATGKVREEDAGLVVRRQFLDRSGKPVTVFKQNDLVVVKITLASITGLEVENVVVTDMLPASFEIENPRLTAPRDMPWLKNESTPDHFDLRDDRVNYFTTANATPKTFYYLVRVVSRGKFSLGPVAADAMYNAALRSYAGAGQVKVE